jgi:transposase
MRPKLSNIDGYERRAPRRCLDRYQFLQRGEAIGPIADVCRRAGISKQTYYLWKRRYAASGLHGLEDRPARPSPGRPRKLTAALTQVLLDHVRQFPTEGCVPLSKRLAEAGIKLISPTVQKALIGWGLGSRESRVKWVQAGCPAVQPGQPIPQMVPVT